MATRKFLIKSISRKRTDPFTGELYEMETTKEIMLKETEPFFLTYSKQIMALYDTDVLNVTTKVLYKMLEFAEWNTGKVCLTPDRMNEILQVCNISRASYYRALQELLDKGIIYRDQGIYIIAENMFWKGTLLYMEAPQG